MHSKPTLKVTIMFFGPQGMTELGMALKADLGKPCVREAWPNGIIIHVGAGQYTDDQQGSYWNSGGGYVITAQNGTAYRESCRDRTLVRRSINNVAHWAGDAVVVPAPVPMGFILLGESDDGRGGIRH